MSDISQNSVPSYAYHSATVQGLDPDIVKLRRDEVHDAWYIVLAPQGSVDIRIDLKFPRDLDRDRKGLEELARVAMELAGELGKHQAAEDAAGE